MMFPRDSYLLIPTRGLEDFPRQLPSADADNLLSGWLALWHPYLISATQCAPRCVSATQIPVDLAATVAVLPAASVNQVPEGLSQRFLDVGGVLLQGTGTWRQQQARILARLSGVSTESEAISDDWIADFAALGFAYLQIQLLTRQLRYTSNLDQLMFDNQLSQSAKALLAGDVDEAERMLQSCFDQLGQERDHYYSMDVHLLDFTLLAPSTLGKGIAKQLSQSHPTNFIASAALLQSLDASHPDVSQELRQAVADKRAGLTGGLDRERPLPLMTVDGIRQELNAGARAYAALGYLPPRVFTMYSYGQVPDMPLHLRRSGFIGSLLVAWQDGSYPSGSHSKFSWETSEGTYLSAVTPPLIDALDPSSYLSLGYRLGEALDHQHVPVFAFAHWPNQISPYFDLFVRTLRRTPALGRWTTIEDFFDKTDQPYHQEQLPPSQFTYDWLGHSNILERTRRYHQFSTRARSLLTLVNLSFQLQHFHDTTSDGTPTGASSSSTAVQPTDASGNSILLRSPDEVAEVPHVEIPVLPRALELNQLSKELATIWTSIGELMDDSNANEGAEFQSLVARIDSELSDLQTKTLAEFAFASGYRVDANGASQLVLNPLSGPCRVAVAGSATLSPPADSKWAYATGMIGNDRVTMCDVPAMGMVRADWVRSSEPARKREKSLAESADLIMNDFLEAQIDPRTGAMRSLHVPGKRGNRLSFQIARREKTDSDVTYSTMRAKEVRVVHASPVFAHVRAIGQLMFENRSSGNYEIDYELHRGSRVVSIHVKLSSLEALKGSPWKSGYVLRTAWPTESAIVSARSAGTRHVWTKGRTVAPLLVEIDETDYRTQLLWGGLAFHQRVEQRFMETLIVGKSGTSCDVRFGVGVDLPNAVQSAKQFVDSPYSVAVASSNHGPVSSWLMHLDAKSVSMELEAPLVDERGRCRGVRVFLLETANKSAACRIRALREVADAHRVDYLGQRMSQLTVEGDTVSVTLRPNEISLVDLLWK